MNDIDLEQEFQILMRTVLKQIGDKKANGELTDQEAEQLTDMVNERMQPPQPAWSSSGCYIDNSDDDGWRGSSLNC